MQNKQVKSETLSLNPEDFITVKEAAAAAHMKGSDTIRRAVKRGELKAYKLRGHQYLIDRESFRQWFANRLTKVEPPKNS